MSITSVGSMFVYIDTASQVNILAEVKISPSCLSRVMTCCELFKKIGASLVSGWGLKSK